MFSFWLVSNAGEFEEELSIKTKLLMSFEVFLRIFKLFEKTW